MHVAIFAFFSSRNCTVSVVVQLGRREPRRRRLPSPYYPHQLGRPLPVSFYIHFSSQRAVSALDDPSLSGQMRERNHGLNLLARHPEMQLSARCSRSPQNTVDDQRARGKSIGKQHLRRLERRARRATTPSPSKPALRSRSPPTRIRRANFAA